MKTSRFYVRKDVLFIPLPEMCENVHFTLKARSVFSDLRIRYYHLYVKQISISIETFSKLPKLPGLPIFPFIGTNF